VYKIVDVDSASIASSWRSSNVNLHSLFYLLFAFSLIAVATTGNDAR